MTIWPSKPQPHHPGRYDSNDDCAKAAIEAMDPICCEYLLCYLSCPLHPYTSCHLMSEQSTATVEECSIGAGLTGHQQEPQDITSLFHRRCLAHPESCWGPLYSHLSCLDDGQWKETCCQSLHDTGQHRFAIPRQPVLVDVCVQDAPRIVRRQQQGISFCPACTAVSSFINRFRSSYCILTQCIHRKFSLLFGLHHTLTSRLPLPCDRSSSIAQMQFMLQ